MQLNMCVCVYVHVHMSKRTILHPETNLELLDCRQALFNIGPNDAVSL
jgi:hypothetical protein